MDKNVNIKIFLGMSAIIIIISILILVNRYIQLNPDTIETFEFIENIQEKNLGTVEIQNGKIRNESQIEEFIKLTQDKELNEQIVIDIIAISGEIECNSTLKYVPLSGITEKNHHITEKNRDSVYLESGYYELRTYVNEVEQIEMFEADNWYINKEYESGNIKFVIDSKEEKEPIILASYITTILDISETLEYEIGFFDKIEEGMIYFVSMDNIVSKIKVDNNTKVLNARTSEYTSVENINKDDIIVLEKKDSLEIKVFRNKTEEDLRKELLLNLSLEEEQRLYNYDFTIEDVHILGEKEAIVTGYVIDNYNIEDYGKDDKKIEFKVMFTENTIFESKGNNINNVKDLEDAKENMNKLILDPYTLEEQYPKVVYIKSIDN